MILTVVLFVQVILLVAVLWNYRYVNRRIRLMRADVGRCLDRCIEVANAHYITRGMALTNKNYVEALQTAVETEKTKVIDQDMRIQKLEMFVENVKDNAKKIREQQEEHKRQIQSRFAR